MALLLAEYLAAVGLDMRGRSFVNLALAYPVYRSGSSFAKALATGHLIAIARTCLDAEDAFTAQRIQMLEGCRRSLCPEEDSIELSGH